MPADTKLYLYTDPAGLLGRAASTFEPDQFAGWVPHQQITYLWPSGPWFWFFDAIGVPDWIAHRLWIGTILFAAGAGVRWCARQLGFARSAALAAAVIYQASPYVLAYISRTSLLLLPWAGLGWIVGITIKATTQVTPFDNAASRVRRELGRWYYPSLIALVVLTVGSVNATALLMIVPGPVLWLVHAVRQHDSSVRPVVGFAARTGALCVAVSLWWMAMLLVQSRHGAPVLDYSETLRDVSRNSSGSEVVRGLGYWLFYIADPFGRTTEMAVPYLISTRTIAVSFAPVVIGLIGIGLTRWRDRGFAASLTVVGAVVAVGVHPIEHSSIAMRVLSSDGSSGLALALRSSTRALPVFVLGVALGCAACVQSFRWPSAISNASLATGARLSSRHERLGALALIGGLAILNLPALWQAGLVDTGIDRDEQVPAAWTEAAATIDNHNARVLQLPGAEFGAFDWGYTVDQPAVGMVDRVVTRDLLPLGSAAAMDLVFAFDDRVQLDVLEAESVAPIARLLGANTIWLTNDQESIRFRTPAPGELYADLTNANGSTAPGIAAVSEFGTVTPAGGPGVDGSRVDLDTLAAPTSAIARSALLTVADPVGLVRTHDQTVVLSGSGDGLIDAAGAGLIDGNEAILYSASGDASGNIEELLGRADHVIITDSNRDRAHHWRGSQDVVGQTETGGPGTDFVRPSEADQRLDVFPAIPDEHQQRYQTVAVQVGPVTAEATAYGEPFAYRPEDRAAMAVDGDLTTAWRVGDHGNPVGETLRLTPTDPTLGAISQLRFLQVAPTPGGRWITEIQIAHGDDADDVVLLDESSLSPPGQTVPLGYAVTEAVEITITDVELGDASLGASRVGVGFAEVDVGMGPTTEYVRPPLDVLGQLSPDDAVPVTLLFSRDRVGATEYWRHDPEPTLRRVVDLAAPMSLDAEAMLRLDERASDADIAAVIGDEGAISSRRYAGPAFRGAAAVDGDLDTAWLTPVDEAVGSQLRLTSFTGHATGLALRQPAGNWSKIQSIRVQGANGAVSVAVEPPGEDGFSVIEFPEPIRGATGDGIEITVESIDAAVRTERRYGERVTLPAGLAEIEIINDAGGRASVGIPIDDTVTFDCTQSALRLNGTTVALTGELSTQSLLAGEPLIARACGEAVTIDAGRHFIEGADHTGLQLDRVVMTTPLAAQRATEAPAHRDVVTVTSEHARSRTAEATCPDGCWLVLGEGFNSAWSAQISDATNQDAAIVDLGEPTLIDGGFNGWWLEPRAQAVSVTMSWTAQQPVSVALAATALAALCCFGAVAAGWTSLRTKRARFPSPPVIDTSPMPVPRRSRRWVAGRIVAFGAFTWLFVTPYAAWLVVLVIAASSVAVLRWPSARVAAVTGLALMLYVALAVVVTERRRQPIPNAGWTTEFEHLSTASLVAMILVAWTATQTRHVREPVEA